MCVSPLRCRESSEMWVLLPSNLSLAPQSSVTKKTFRSSWVVFFGWIQCFCGLLHAIYQRFHLPITTYSRINQAGLIKQWNSYCENCCPSVSSLLVHQSSWSTQKGKCGQHSIHSIANLGICQCISASFRKIPCWLTFLMLRGITK